VEKALGPKFSASLILFFVRYVNNLKMQVPWKSLTKSSLVFAHSFLCPSSVQAVYNRRKNALFRRATEMSNMCDCEVAVIMFTPDGELAQFSTSSMEDMLRRYSRSCTDLHETQTREGMNKRAAATALAAVAANGGGAPAANGGGPAKKRIKEESNGGGRGSGRNFTDANDSDTAEAILSMQGLPPLAPAPELPSQDMDLEFNKLIEERAKRAQQQQAAANAVSGGVNEALLTRNPSGSASERDAAAEAGPGPSSAFLAAVGAVPAAAPASAIDSLADLLKGSDPAPLHSIVKSDPNESPNHPAPTADVDTPTVAPYPPVAGTVELPSMLGPIAGEQPAAE
jgi:SRF-type transcription factor (DNA-binding and dimerisation domain)